MNLLSLSIAAADDGALPIPALPEHTRLWRGAASSVLTTTNTTPILPTSIGASSVGKHHCRLGSMGKIKRMPERRLRPLYVSVSLLFIAFFLSLSLSTCFLVVLVHVSSLSVHGYSLFSPLDCFCPFFPRLFLRRHSRMSCVLLLFSVFLFVCHCFHLSSQQCLAFFDIRLVWGH